MKLFAGINIYENIVLENDSIIEDLEYSYNEPVLKWEKRMVKNNDEISLDSNIKNFYGIPVPYEYRNRVNLHSEALSNLSEMFENSFTPSLEQYVMEYGVKLESCYGYDILKYEIGNHWSNHIDDHPNFPCRVVAEYFINEDYEGGEIEFINFDIKIKPSKNSLIVYPASYPYINRVNPIISGTRYSVLQWFR
jgi:hypothetical protein